jgi:hypothetical protein
MSPKTFKSQTTTQITTTAFRIDFIDPAIGMKVLISQRRTPTTIRTTSTWISGIVETSGGKVGVNPKREI